MRKDDDDDYKSSIIIIIEEIMYQMYKVICFVSIHFTFNFN